MPMKRNGSEINSDTCSDDEIESGMANNVTHKWHNRTTQGKTTFPQISSARSIPLDYMQGHQGFAVTSAPVHPSLPTIERLKI